MNPPENDFEQNLGRLLKATCGPEVAVSHAARERLRAELAFRPNQRPQPAEFPELALAFLTAFVWVPFAAGALGAWKGAAGWASVVPSGPILALVMVNFIGLPVASLVIVLRRKYA